MPIPTSEYRIPIFISSTDYNLRDLRAETASYLDNLGYRPILSSAEGFHDSSPDLAPWESCLQVLSTCHIMILVIDSKYGYKFEWKNFKKEIADRKVSPTHAEYLFSYHHRKRMLVFIRDEVLVHYQSYRTSMKSCGGDKEAAKEKLTGVIPSYIEFETLAFIEEVKTANPIPWIRAFKDVTDLKKEVHKKLLNELGEIFLIRDKHIEVVTKTLSTILEEVGHEKRVEILRTIGTTREIIDKLEEQNNALSSLKVEQEENTKLIADYKTQIESASQTAERDNAKIKKLENDLKTATKKYQLVENQIEILRGNNAWYLSGSLYNLPSSNSDIFNLSSDMLSTSNPFSTYVHKLWDPLLFNEEARLAISKDTSGSVQNDQPKQKVPRKPKHNPSDSDVNKQPE